MRWSAPVTMTWRPAAMPQDGIRPGRMRLQALDADGAILAGPRSRRSMRSASSRPAPTMSRFIVGALLPALVDHLNEGAEADGDEEGDDQGGHGPAQRGLGDQEPDDRPVSRSTAPIL